MDRKKDARKFAEILYVLAHYFEKKLDKTRIELYFQGLMEFSVQEVEQGCKKAICQLTFFPKVAELRKLILEDRGNNREWEKLEAWEVVMENRHRAGCICHDEVFPVKGLNETLRLLGGWRAVAMWKEDELVFRRMDFFKIFDIIAERKEQESLPGPGLADILPELGYDRA